LQFDPSERYCYYYAHLERYADGLREGLVIAAALGVQDPRERPIERREAADQIHATFEHEDSDFLAFLNLWGFLEAERRHRTKNKFRKLCELHFLSWNRVEEWHDIHQQLRALTHEMGFSDNSADARYEQVHQAVLSGLLGNLGFRDEGREYLGARGSRFFIHPSSGLFEKGPKWIMAAERVETTRHYGRIVARIQPEWVERAAPHLLQRSYSEAHWDAASGQVGAYERVTLYGLPIVAKRRVNYGPINPAESRELFIRFALVEGDFDTRAPFWRHNRELIDQVRQLEHKSRRRDLLVDEEGLYGFYAARIPEGIYSKPLFERWLRGVTRTDPKRLHLRMSDLLQPEARVATEEAFPDFLQVGGTRLPLEYHFDPGHPADGVTLVVPLPLVNQISAERCEWLVPGLLEERIVALLRGLPKAIRKQLVPIPDTARELVRRLGPSERPLLVALADELRAMKGLYIPGDAWDESAVPEHLRMNLRLTDEQGNTLAAGRELGRLKQTHGQAGQDQFARIPAAGLERDGITRWDFDTLAEAVTLERGGIRLLGYPALVDRGDSVSLAVLDSPENAARAMRAGLRRLLMLHLGGELRTLRKNLPELNRLRLQYAKAAPPAGSNDSAADIAEELIALTLDLTFLEGRPPLRQRAEFEARLAENKGALMGVGAQVCRLVGEILERYQTLRQQLAAITQPHWLPTLEDLHRQCDALVFRGFLQTTPYAALKHYPRYLRAALIRVERLRYGAAQDQRGMSEMAPLLEKWCNRREAARKARRQDPRLEEIRWQLEELRVSLFAQQVGTAYPVSVQRIEKHWRALGL